MSINLMSRIGFICFAVTLGLAGISYAALPQVIGDWEDSNDGWELFAEAPDGTTAHFVKENATVRLAEGRNAGFVGRSETAGSTR
jgi:hypothetical protein